MATLAVVKQENKSTPGPILSSAAFSLEDPESVWCVQSGSLELFLVSTKDGVPAGARHHVMQVGEGQAVFGIGEPLCEVTLLAVSAPGTVLRRVSLDSLRRRAADAEPAALQMLAEWVTSLSRILSDDYAKGQTMLLDPGHPISIPPPTRAVFPAQGLLWAAHTKGKSIFRNAMYIASDPGLLKKFVVDGSTVFPVTRYAWLQSTPGSEINGIETSEVWRSDPEWRGLRKFHAMVMELLAINRRTKEEKEQQRVKMQVAAEETRLSVALQRLTEPLRKTEEVGEVQDTCRNSMFLAFAAVGSSMGLKIRPPSDMVRGLRLADPIGSIAISSGVRVRTVVLKGDWWRQDVGPLLAIREDGKVPVALLPRSAGSYELYNPVDQQRVAVSAEVTAGLQAFAYMLYRPFPAKKLGVIDLLRFGLPLYKRELTLISLMGAGAGILGTITPMATGIIFDRLIPGAERNQLVWTAIFLLIIALGTAMFNYARSFALLRLEGKLDASIEAAVWDRLLSLPVSFFRDYSSGDLAQRSLGITAIRQAVTGATSNSLFSAVFSIFVFAELFYYSTSLALVAAGLVFVAFLVTTACGVIQVGMQRQMAAVSGRISSMLLQFISGIAKFRVSGTENRVFAVWSREFSRKKKIATRARYVSNVIIIFYAMFPTICLAAIFYFQQMLMSKPDADKLTTGDFLAFFSGFSQVMAAAVSVSAALITIVSVFPQYERARPIFQSVPEVTEKKTSPGTLTGAIEISHVTFRYKSDAPPVLRDVSITIRPGEFIAIVGPSGSGKSTLLRMLLGFETPESGAVYFDGQDISGLDVQQVRRQMGVVLQSSRPISGSILQNIVGSAPLSVEDAWEAARLAGIDEDIRRMPMQLHTYLSDGGGGISGGQRQRLMIARAVAARPRILLFDEATSALDNQTQAIVSRSLETLQATRIVIAHRLSTIMNATRIFVMDKGEVVQSGTYQELIEKDGIFTELAKRQML
jgi:NHLM bacteriocin system ABC transporter ATP-binding protein